MTCPDLGMHVHAFPCRPDLNTLVAAAWILVTEWFYVANNRKLTCQMLRGPWP